MSFGDREPPSPDCSGKRLGRWCRVPESRWGSWPAGEGCGVGTGDAPGPLAFRRRARHRRVRPRAPL